MDETLFDSKGYKIDIIITKTFNPFQAGVNEDRRDLGVFLEYAGARIAQCPDTQYKTDHYVLSRLEFPYHGEWNEQAVRGFYAPEPKGIWCGHRNTLFLKDSGIRKSGLKIVYYVPNNLTKLRAQMKVYVNDELLKETLLDREGIFTDVIDVNNAGREEQEYLVQAHRILKILLTEFIRVCNKYDLRYYLICGSLLGAVRHKNLIPWDDDVDVAMPRRDFDILRRYAGEEWGNGSDILFLDYDQMGNHAFLDFMTRIVYMKEEIPVNVFRKIKGKGRKDVDCHLPLDIYVLDNASAHQAFHQLQTQMIQGLYGLAMGHRAYIDPKDYANRDRNTQRMVSILSTIGKYIPLPLIFACYEWVRKWNKNKACENYFESNGFIYCIPWKFRQEWFGEGTSLCVDDISVSVPQDYEAFLKVHYGDFMQYPAMEMRKPTHSIDASGVF